VLDFHSGVGRDILRIGEALDLTDFKTTKADMNAWRTTREQESVRLDD